MSTRRIKRIYVVTKRKEDGNIQSCKKIYCHWTKNRSGITTKITIITRRISSDRSTWMDYPESNRTNCRKNSARNSSNENRTSCSHDGSTRSTIINLSRVVVCHGSMEHFIASNRLYNLEGEIWKINQT